MWLIRSDPVRISLLSIEFHLRSIADAPQMRYAVHRGARCPTVRFVHRCHATADGDADGRRSTVRAVGDAAAPSAAAARAVSRRFCRARASRATEAATGKAARRRHRSSDRSSTGTEKPRHRIRQPLWPRRAPRRTGRGVPQPEVPWSPSREPTARTAHGNFHYISNT